MRKFNVRPTARHITESNYRNSNEKIVGADGHINAGSTQEVMIKLAEIASMIGTGELYTDASHALTPETASTLSRADIEEAMADPALWAEVGTSITSEIQTRLMRDGFMRSFLSQGNVDEGATPRLRIRTPNTRAIIAKGLGENYAQYVNDRYMPVDEYTISANIRVENLAIHQGSGNILEDKFYEAQEQFLVKEDRVLVSQFRTATGMYNNATYFSGSFNPVIFAGLRETLTGWSLPASKFLFSNDILTDFMVGSDFSEYYDPITKYEIIQTGRVGSIFGLEMYTDGYREETLRVLNQGECFMTSSPEQLGAYTDRGPIQSNPVDSYSDGVAARGWFMFEYLSTAVANAKAVVTASR